MWPPAVGWVWTGTWEESAPKWAFISSLSGAVSGWPDWLIRFARRTWPVGFCSSGLANGAVPATPGFELSALLLVVGRADEAGALPAPFHSKSSLVCVGISACGRPRIFLISIASYPSVGARSGLSPGGSQARSPFDVLNGRGVPGLENARRPSVENGAPSAGVDREVGPENSGMTDRLTLRLGRTDLRTGRITNWNGGGSRGA